MDSTTVPADSVQGPSPRMVTGPYTVPRSTSFASLAEMIGRRPPPTQQIYHDSFGKQAKDLKDQMRWDLAGKALQQWNDVHGPRLTEIMENNAKEICKGENDADCIITRRCYMLGRDKSHAHPTIVLFCDRDNQRNAKRILKRSMRVISQADDFSEFADSGFEFRLCLLRDLNSPGGLMGCSAEITHPIYDQATPGPISLSGQQILVNNTMRFATIGGTIIIDGAYHALTVAHPFSETSHGDASSHQGSEVELFTMEWALGSDDGSDDEDTAHDSGHGSVASGGSNSPALRDPIVLEVTPLSPEPGKPSENAGFDHYRSLDVTKSNLPMDWVTMRLDDDRFFAANEVFLPFEDNTNQNKWMYLEKEKLETPRGEVVIIDQKKVLKASGISAMSTGKLKSSGTEIALWALNSRTTLSKGICGSWALDSQTHEILGPVVAGSETLGEIFIVPMKDILKSVREEHRASEVRFPSRTDSLWLAVYYGNTAAVVRLLKTFDNFPSDIPEAPIQNPIFNRIYQDGATMLHWSAWKGYRTILEMLCAAGGDINARTKSMKTPLHLACFLSPEEACSPELKRRKESTVELLLLQEGIDVNATDKDDKTPLMIAEETEFEYAQELFENQTYTRQESSFFTPGRMFATPFHDRLAEASLDRYKGNTTPNGAAEKHNSRIRQFIVVKECHGFCYACPVSTYGGRGTAREGLTPRTHAIVYTMDTTPTYVAGETPLSIAPIPVVPSNDGVTLEKSSRIDFAIYYPINHDCRVKDLGIVHKDYIPLLAQYAGQESDW